ncbi:MAG: lytic murein transglycosylase [Thermodesulfobacteriota bacterium]
MTRFSPVNGILSHISYHDPASGKIRFLFVFIFLLVFTVLFHQIPGASAGKNQGFADWLKDFKEEAVSVGISEKTVEKALAGIEYNKKIIKLDRNQPEFKLSLFEYLNKMVSRARIKKGREKLAADRDLLEKIEKSYGVSPHYLIALWGMESYYCRYTGKFPILEALASLSYDPRRSQFFKKELLAALDLLDRGSILLADMKGSWAGALGCLQFLPSVFKEYGVDFNGDGRIEIFKAGGDLFASAAFYLKDSGWQPGGRWGGEVLVPWNLDRKLLAGSPPRPVSFWLKKGIKFKNREKRPKKNLKASLIQPDTLEKRYFLTFTNFNVLLKWNRSDYYAIATGILADRIRGGI